MTTKPFRGRNAWRVLQSGQTLGIFQVEVVQRLRANQQPGQGGLATLSWPQQCHDAAAAQRRSAAFTRRTSCFGQSAPACSVFHTMIIPLQRRDIHGCDSLRPWPGPCRRARRLGGEAYQARRPTNAPHSSFVDTPFGFRDRRGSSSRGHRAPRYATRIS